MSCCGIKDKSSVKQVSQEVKQITKVKDSKELTEYVLSFKIINNVPRQDKEDIRKD